MLEKLSSWSSADYLHSEQDIARYFEACIEDDDGDACHGNYCPCKAYDALG